MVNGLRSANWCRSKSRPAPTASARPSRSRGRAPALRRTRPAEGLLDALGALAGIVVLLAVPPRSARFARPKPLPNSRCWRRHWSAAGGGRVFHLRWPHALFADALLRRGAVLAHCPGTQMDGDNDRAALRGTVVPVGRQRIIASATHLPLMPSTPADRMPPAYRRLAGREQAAGVEALLRLREAHGGAVCSRDLS